MGNTKKQMSLILDHMLKEVTFDCWSDDALQKAVIAAGVDKDDTEIIFPGGVSDIVNFFISEYNDKMCKALKKKKLENMKIRERIACGVMTRLFLHNEHKEAIRKLLSYYTIQGNVFQGMRHLAKVASLIWYAAGDTSSDFNYYTKRGLLGGVLTSTSIYWLNDQSEGHYKTEKFLNRRINDVMKIHTVRTKAESIIGKMPYIRKVFGL